jgi:phosphate-selective porin OprO and OprP
MRVRDLSLLLGHRALGTLVVGCLLMWGALALAEQPGDQVDVRDESSVEDVSAALSDAFPEESADTEVPSDKPLFVAAEDAQAALATSDDSRDEAVDELSRLRLRIEQLEQANQKRTATEKSKAEADKQKKADDELKKKLDALTKWDVKLGGHVQLDYINWVHSAPSIPNAQDYVEFRRLRLVADGKGYENYDFRLQLTLEPESVGDLSTQTPEVKDAYFSINEIPGLGRFRIGNFFVPFSLEQVTNDTMNIFVERSIPTQGVYAADREVGMALYNATEDRNITWTTGFFFDSVSEALKERIDDNQGYRISGRVTGLPYYDEESDGRYLVHVGAGVLFTDDQDERVRFRARPQIREGPRLIDSGPIDAQSYTTGNLEFATVWGSFTIQSEAFLSTTARTNGDATQTHGAYVHTSYFLTGENRVFEKFGQHGAQFGRNVPNCRVGFDEEGMSLGAWEFKTRWSYLNLNQFDRGVYNDLTVGMNWYWSDRVRVMFDYIHPVTSSEAVFGSTNSDILAMRFDFNW